MDIGDIWAGFGEDESRLFDQAIGEIADEFGASMASDIQSDQWVGFLYHEAMWDFEIAPDYRQGAYDAFMRYMEENYGIEWEDVYDWEAYREAYDDAH